MTKAKISEYSATAGDNTDVNGVNIAEGCPPSSMNNMGREIMAALKRYQVGSDGDGVTVGGNLVVSGSTTVNTFSSTVFLSDTINEKTAAAGVTVDGVLLKDSEVTTDVIKEKTSATGVTIDGVLLKDSGVVTGAGTVSAPVYSTTGDLNTGIFFPAADNIGFATGGTIRGRWTTDGLCFGSDTAAANALDDYEEGTWTIQLFDDPSGGNQSSTTSTGYYTKIGRSVTAQIGIDNINTTGMTGANTLYFTLPFTASADNISRTVGGAIIRTVSFPSGFTSIAARLNTNNIRGQFEFSGSGQNSVGLIVSNVTSGSSDLFTVITYNAA